MITENIIIEIEVTIFPHSCATESLCSGRETAQTIDSGKVATYQGIYCPRNMCNATKSTHALGEMNFTFLAFTMIMDMYRAW